MSSQNKSLDKLISHWQRLFILKIKGNTQGNLICKTLETIAQLIFTPRLVIESFLNNTVGLRGKQNISQIGDFMTLYSSFKHG